jgi:hypothetical protein
MPFRWTKTHLGRLGAILEPAESIGAMVKAIGGLVVLDNGKFLLYNGKEVRW